MTITLALMLVGCLLTAPAFGSWFSKLRYQDGAGQQVEEHEKRNSDIAVFDLSVSLYNDPAGDDDPNFNGNGEQQTAYENIIRHWADAVCEQSNGGHRLGRIRLFRQGAFATRADVVWNASEGPRAYASGYGVDGLHIIFGDSFPGGCGTGCNINFLQPARQKSAGYTLGHELGHYAYGLYDEYQGSNASGPITQPRSTDIAVEPSVMANQWRAVGGNLDWLNFSTQDNFEARTAQGRVYEASGWDVLLTDPNDDPRDGDLSTTPERVLFSTLQGRAPTAADGWIVTDLDQPGNGCRDTLEILWMADQDLELQVVIDRSGSMAGSAIVNARQASKNLVEVVPEGQTALGVVSFSSSVRQDFDITAIPTPGSGVKQAIKGVIDTINASGLTAMFDAADFALDGLDDYRNGSGTSANRVVFLLSDGGDNVSSTSQSAVTASYLAGDVPLVTFGYGSFAPTGVLRQLADDTGGQFFSSPTTLAEIQSAFLSAITSVSSSVGISTFQAPAPAASSNVELASFEIDGTLESFDLIASHDGASDALDLTLRGPAGQSVAAAFSCESGAGATSCSGRVDAATLASIGAGSWTLRGTNRTVANVNLEGSVVASPSDGRTYDVIASSLRGSTVSYPEPILVTASIGQGMLITDVQVMATVTAPDGSQQTLTMRDDGQAGDGRAADGIYSLLLGYDQDGLFTVDIQVANTGSARFAQSGYGSSPTEGGGAANLPQPPPINDLFQRRAQVQVTVEGVFSSGGDDHPDSPLGSTMAADNADIAGRIDSAGDLDYFRIDNVTANQPTVVRVAGLALGMNPRLTVYAANGSTQLAQGDLTTHLSAGGYLAIRLNAAQVGNNRRLVAKVEQAGNASGGVYQISAGDALATDGPPVLEPCISGNETLCLNAERFRVEVSWRDFEGNTGSGRVVPFGSDDSGMLWFFNADNWEMLLKVLDGCAINDRFWVFAAATTNVEVELRVTDTLTGVEKRYFNGLGTAAPSLTDTGAFATCSAGTDQSQPQGADQQIAPLAPVPTPVPTPQSTLKSHEVSSLRLPWKDNFKMNCTAGNENLCLNADRFRVEVEWQDFDGNTGTGKVVPFGSDDSGLFWFFEADNWEMLVKVLNGCGLNNHYWVFSAATTNVRYTLRVTDTETGEVKEYTNPLGTAAAALTDTGAFATCP